MCHHQVGERFGSRLTRWTPNRTRLAVPAQDSSAADLNILASTHRALATSNIKYIRQDEEALVRIQSTDSCWRRSRD